MAVKAPVERVPMLHPSATVESVSRPVLLIAMAKNVALTAAVVTVVTARVRLLSAMRASAPWTVLPTALA